MISVNIFIDISLSLLLCPVAGARDIRSVIKLCRDESSKEGCCTPTPPEDFKNCVAHKRRSLPVPYLGFKSMSSQCHTTPVSTGIRTQTRHVQIFRQCFFTDKEFKEREPARYNNRLLQACRYGDLPSVQHIISADPENINAKDRDELTPIMTAAKFGRTEVFNFLSCSTCTWTARDKFNNNILHFACIGGSLEIVKRVLSFRLFKLDCRGEKERTALLLAVRSGHKDVAELLLKRGCDSVVTDRFGNNMLHLACKSKNITVLKYVMAKYLFSLESQNLARRTPLLEAAERGFIQGCKFLVKQGADVTAVDELDNTVLHLALSNDAVPYKVRVRLVQYLMRLLNELQPRKEFLRKRNLRDRTPKELAWHKGFYKIIYLLNTV